MAESSGHGFQFAHEAIQRSIGMTVGYVISLGFIGKNPRTKVTYVRPSQWRKKVYGSASLNKVHSKDWKTHAMGYCQTLLGLSPKDDNEAEANIIASGYANDAE